MAKHLEGTIVLRVNLAVTITKKAAEGFRTQPRRWVVERTFAWLVRYRRLTVDFELLRETSEELIRGAMIHLMLRRPHPQG
jgi:putative transposase